MSRPRSALNLRRVLAGTSLAIATAACGARQEAGPAPGSADNHLTGRSISAEDLVQRVAVLAHDSLLGRESGTIGNVRAVAYIAGEASRLGLEPAGDSGTFLQHVPLVIREPDPASVITVGATTLRHHSQLLPLRALTGAPLGGRFSGDAVGTIYGGRLGGTLVTPEQARGLVVVFAPRLGPDGRATPQTLGGPADAISRYGDAAAILIGGLESLPSGIVAFLRQPVVAAVTTPRAAMAAARVATVAAEQILGGSLGSLAVGARGGRVSGSFGLLERAPDAPSHNVVAIIRGTDSRLRNTYVAIGSHSDHVGVSPVPLDHDSVFAFNRVLRRSGANEPARVPNYDQARRVRAIRDSLRTIRSPRMDSIFNGADDNASGVAVALELAEYLVGRPPRRSLLFVWHTAEEKGLFGAAHFTDFPAVPRDSIVAQINMDQVSRGGGGDIEGAAPRTMYVLGSRRLSKELGELVESVNAGEPHRFTLDYSLDEPAHPANGYCRSDHYMYARYGIPVVFFSAGWHPDYHMVTDETTYIQPETVLGVARFVKDVVETLANRAERPGLSAPRPDPSAPCRQ